MTTAEEVEPRLEQIRLLLGPDKGATDTLIVQLDQLLAASGGTADRLGIVGARGPERLASARFVADFLDDPERLSARPSWEEDLAVVEWVLRPAVPLEGGRAAFPEGRWGRLAGQDFSALAASVCRLDVSRDGGIRTQAGSGFFVTADDGEPAIVTAAHVISSVEALGWPRGPIHLLAINAEDPRAGTPTALEVTGVRQIDLELDVAVVAVVGGVEVAPLVSAPPPAEGAEIVVLGYPYFDSRLDPWARDFGFREPAGVLRIAPGVSLGAGIRKWRNASIEAFSHDASTLSGSSGSAVFELSGPRLVGVHVGGKPQLTSDVNRFEWNLAVPFPVAAPRQVMKR